ncbi:MAG: hypothetical protein JKY12_06535 [Sneathiella sp.]|nr:hypothetical protein [Sneathiella sp.]
MVASGESTADIRLYNSKRTSARILEEIEEARDEKAAKMVRLRALRLAKEAADKKT